jgi:hypothetical protein
LKEIYPVLYLQCQAKEAVVPGGESLQGYYCLSIRLRSNDLKKDGRMAWSMVLQPKTLLPPPKLSILLSGCLVVETHMSELGFDYFWAFVSSAVIGNKDITFARFISRGKSDFCKVLRIAFPTSTEEWSITQSVF